MIRYNHQYFHFKDVVQYEAVMVLPHHFYDQFNDSDSMEAIKQLIFYSNNYLSGRNFSNTSFFFIEILNTDELK